MSDVELVPFVGYVSLEPEPFLHQLFEIESNLFLAVHDKNLRLILERGEPLQKLLLIGMGRKAIDGVHPGLDCNFLAKHMNMGCAVHDSPAQGADCLEPCKDDAAL